MSSIFTDPKNTNALADIESRANPIGKSVLKPLMMVIAGAGGGMIAGGPVVAGACAALPAWMMIKTLKKDVARNEFTRRHPGNIAHLISNERDMIAWCEGHGRPAVKDQLLLAMQSGQMMTDCARRMATALIPADQVPAKSLKEYLDQSDRALEAGLPSVTALLGGESYAGVAAAGVVSQGVVSQGVAAIDATQDPENVGYDIATDLGTKPQSALVFGTPGAGKGMNISNAIRVLKTKFPSVTVMMVDPKGDQKERGYWENQVDIFESRALLTSPPRSSAEWMMRCVEKFVAIKGQKLLIWDELFATITVLKAQNAPKDDFPCLSTFQQFLSTHFSLGPSSGVWIWGMSQSANLSDLGLTSGGLSTTRIIALVSPDNVGSVEGYLATKAIVAPKGGMAEINRLMDASPVKRACYDGKSKKWYPMAKLENHSGFDRDKADWNNLNASSKLPPEMEAIARITMAQMPQSNPMKSAAPQVPTDEELKDIGRSLSAKIKAIAKGQPADSAIVGAIATQNALAGNGQYREAIQTMIPYVCSSVDDFIAMFPNSQHIVKYLNEVR